MIREEKSGKQKNQISIVELCGSIAKQSDQQKMVQLLTLVAQKKKVVTLIYSENKPVILCGGAGTRLFPKNYNNDPKAIYRFWRLELI